MMKIKILFSVLVLLISLESNAQKGFEVGGFVGGAQYYGDLNTSVNFSRAGVRLGAIGMYNFDNRLAARVSLNYGRLRGTDTDATKAFERNRNLSFYSNIYDINAGLEFSFFEYNHGSEDKNFSPYVTLGLAALKYNPKAELNGTTYTLRKYGTEGQGTFDPTTLNDPEPQLIPKYSLISWGPTLGLGIKTDITRDISIALEGTMRFTRTDYIDDVSTNYPSFTTINGTYGNGTDIPEQLSNRTLNSVAGNPGNQRGTSTKKDNYLLAGIRITKYFRDKSCPKVKH